jgi:hypothetical protein
VAIQPTRTSDDVCDFFATQGCGPDNPAERGEKKLAEKDGMIPDRVLTMSGGLWYNLGS